MDTKVLFTALEDVQEKIETLRRTEAALSNVINVLTDKPYHTKKPRAKQIYILGKLQDELSKRGGQASVRTLTTVTGLPNARIAASLNQAAKRKGTGIHNIMRGVYAYTKPNGVTAV